MSYEIIDEDLKLEACGIGDLTAEQVNYFLGLWEKDCPLSTLTIFREGGALVLNKDNKHYGIYKDCTIEYMRLDEQQRKELKKDAPESIKEVFNIIDEAIEIRETAELVRIVGCHPIETSKKAEHACFSQWVYKYGTENILFICHLAYTLGQIQGKRFERARRKRGRKE